MLAVYYEIEPDNKKKDNWNKQYDDWCNLTLSIVISYQFVQMFMNFMSVQCYYIIIQ